MRTIHPDTAPQIPEDDLPGSYPAGKVVAVVILALFLAALLDADSLFASVSSERFGTSRTVELALVRPFRAVSDAVGLNLPHRWLADIGGTNQAHLNDSFTSSAAFSATDGAIRDLLQPRVRVRPTSARTGANRNGPRRPQAISAAAPLKLWIAGDSLIGVVSDALVSHVVGNPAVQATTDVQIGTGLARPDVYDWPAAIAQEMQQKQPDVVVLAFGANDAQDMVAGNRYLVRISPAWQAEYARRVSLVMSEVATAGRMLIWLEVPPVARPRLQQTAQIINPIVEAQARLHPGVIVVNPGRVLTTANGAYTTYLPGPSGQPIQVRDADGIHLTPAGADRVIPLILAAIRQEWKLP